MTGGETHLQAITVAEGPIAAMTGEETHLHAMTVTEDPLAAMTRRKIRLHLQMGVTHLLNVVVIYK
jgi:hypothetical protein